MKPIAMAIVVALAATPLYAQAPRIDFDAMVVTGEERARINKEFADLYNRKTSLEEKLYNCQSAHFVNWREWW